MGLLNKLFGKAPNPDDDWGGVMANVESRLKLMEERQRHPEKAMKKLLAGLPPCNRYVVLASAKYNQPEYFGDVIAEACDLLHWIQDKSKNEGWDDYATKGLLQWLGNADNESGRLTPIPPELIDYFSGLTEQLIDARIAFMHCPECDSSCENLIKEEMDKRRSGNTTYWNEEWRCDEGHVLLKKECKFHVSYR